VFGRLRFQQFKVIRKSVKKTDKNDAAALALFLEKDMLPETRVKTSAENELASLAHTRDLLVKQRTRLLNKIHALHVGKGLKLKKESLGSKRGLAAIDMALFSPCEQVEITVLRETALSLTASLKQLDTEIEKHASALTGYEGIVSIKGVGPRSAAVLLAAIGNVHDFESADKLAAYFAWCRALPSRTRPTTAAGSPSAATSWRAPPSSSAASSPRATRHTSRTSTSASASGAAPERP
jgi:transposase